ncbi:MAG: hypothetical protein IPP47_33295 [Bryobacterales bacterium]|nr:hypothetical protein [Bryobacterales bacterium]
MNPRRLLTATLIGFVLVSFGYLALRGSRAAKGWRSPAVAEAATTDSAPAGESGKVIAYYFHVTVRCTTCRAIESYSKEVITARFGPELASGRLEWRLVNLQLPENKHFVQDYQLFTKSLVLVRTENGKQRDFKVLNDTWELVGNKTAMQSYVEKEVRGFLRKLG